MSSSIPREPLSGLIHQDKKIVGAICLPDEDVHDFIEQFNHCYGPLRMRIVPPAIVLPLATPTTVPVGASFRRPYQEPPQAHSLSQAQRQAATDPGTAPS